MDLHEINLPERVRLYEREQRTQLKLDEAVEKKRISLEDQNKNLKLSLAYYRASYMWDAELLRAHSLVMELIPLVVKEMKVEGARLIAAPNVVDLLDRYGFDLSGERA